ncbi:MAG: hypothetical protein WC242_00035 [Candidatus Paceibacterota bacterium]|jgi:hypothetical protein
MEKEKTITSRLPKETEQQYTAWLLYCEVGSIEKLIRLWDGVGQNLDESWMVFARRLGKRPSHTTIGNWSKRYNWIQRRESKIVEDLELLKQKLKKIKREKLYKIAEAFDKIANKILKQLRSDKEPTILEWKMVWEMLQVELGKPTTRAQLNTAEQRPLTPEEKERGKKIHEAVKWYLEQQHKKEDIEQTDKKS